MGATIRGKGKSIILVSIKLKFFVKIAFLNLIAIDQTKLNNE